ncbi:MAG: response regulator [Anaerolineales bacterium]
MIKILIVDDSAFSRNALRRILESDGYTVLEAESGMRALELLQSDAPDVVTLDLLMPEMSGQQVLQNMRQINPHIRVIVITADIQRATRQELDEMGADAFLQKPFGSNEILATLKRVLGE